jgi:hypothetical protein
MKNQSENREIVKAETLRRSAPFGFRFLDFPLSAFAV